MPPLMLSQGHGGAGRCGGCDPARQLMGRPAWGGQPGAASRLGPSWGQQRHKEGLPPLYDQQQIGYRAGLRECTGMQRHAACTKMATKRWNVHTAGQQYSRALYKACIKSKRGCLAGNCVHVEMQTQGGATAVGAAGRLASGRLTPPLPHRRGARRAACPRRHCCRRRCRCPARRGGVRSASRAAW